MTARDPLDVSSITIRAVQFVGTNVEMTYLVDGAASEAEPRLEALLQAKLGLYALTATGEESAPDGRTLKRFSVMASPLDRLFHKIGPSVPLTLIKHTSVTLDLSEINLTRQGQGLMRTNPGPASAASTDDVRARGEAGAPPSEIWTAWDAGKLLGTLLRTPALHDHGAIHVAGVAVQRGAFPNAILADLGDHVAAHGGVVVQLPSGVRSILAG